MPGKNERSPAVLTFAKSLFFNSDGSYLWLLLWSLKFGADGGWALAACHWLYARFARNKPTIIRKMPNTRCQDSA